MGRCPGPASAGWWAPLGLRLLPPPGPARSDRETSIIEKRTPEPGTIWYRAEPRTRWRILLIRGHKVILDADLAELYGVETKALTRAVRRNPERFPGDFMLQLGSQEFANLRRQYGTSSQWGGRRYPPFAFTEQGVAMLSSVLRSRRAVCGGRADREWKRP